MWDAIKDLGTRVVLSSHLKTQNDNKMSDGMGLQTTNRLLPMVLIVVWLLLIVQGEAANQSAITISIAVLLPNDDYWMFSSDRVAPALDLALTHVKEKRLLSKNVDVELYYRDSKCDVAEAINEAFNFYLHGNADVYFGPCCDYAAAPVARQVRFWNTPIVTAGAMAADFATMKKSMYPMMTRVGPNFNSLTENILATFEHFGWAKVKLMYNPSGLDNVVHKFCHLAADALHRAMIARSDIHQDYFKLYTSTYDGMLEAELGREYASK